MLSAWDEIVRHFGYRWQIVISQRVNHTTRCGIDPLPPAPTNEPVRLMATLERERNILCNCN